MAGDEQDVRMTVREIALMRRIIAWRKANDIDFVRRRVMGTYWSDPYGATGPARRAVAIELKHSADAPLGLCGGRHEPYEWLSVATFTEAVDVLVAKGYLPARFSTAYRAGYEFGASVECGSWDDAGWPAWEGED